MTETGPPAGSDAVTVRYFAGARAAAGVDEEIVQIPPGSSVHALIAALSRLRPALAEVLGRCSYLVDTQAARDLERPLPAAATVDVLPPFAGG